MHQLPCDYYVTATAEAAGNVVLKAEDVPQLVTAASVDAGGPGNQWCPELLLIGALTDGLVVGFSAIARTLEFDWNTVSCRAVGTLDRVDKVNQFTSFQIDMTLRVPAGADIEKARRLAQKAHEACVIVNSLHAETQLGIEIVED
jgi:organic hydroperoxide reductase OsmC/OhrA